MNPLDKAALEDDLCHVVEDASGNVIRRYCDFTDFGMGVVEYDEDWCSTEPDAAGNVTRVCVFTTDQMQQIRRGERRGGGVVGVALAAGYVVAFTAASIVWGR